MVIFAGYMVASLLSIFIVLRILHGFAFGMVTVSGNTIVIDILPSSRRGEGLGYYGMANNLAMSFGPMIGLFMHESFSYEVIFSCSLISCFLGFIMAYLVKTPYKQPGQEGTDLARPFLPGERALGRDFLIIAFHPLRHDDYLCGDVCRRDRYFRTFRTLLHLYGDRAGGITPVLRATGG